MPAWARTGSGRDHSDWMEVLGFRFMKWLGERVPVVQVTAYRKRGGRGAEEWIVRGGRVTGERMVVVSLLETYSEKKRGDIPGNPKPERSDE
jgi:hypothetical protein